MNNLNRLELEELALAYQELMVPALFETWGDRILDEAKVRPGDKILDIACGTGALTRIAEERSGENGFVAGLDINPGMLSVAENLTPGIEWRQGRAEELPWDDDFFDVVISQFGLMFFENQQVALQEMLRVLKSGGRIVVAVFDSLEKNPGYMVITETFGRTVGQEIAQALRFPFSLGDTKKLEKLCAESGFMPVQITTQKAKADFPDIRTMVLADVKGWFPLAGFVLDDNQIEEVISTAEPELRNFIREDGSLSFPLSAHFLIYNQ